MESQVISLIVGRHLRPPGVLGHNFYPGSGPSSRVIALLLLIWVWYWNRIQLLLQIRISIEFARNSTVYGGDLTRHAKLICLLVTVCVKISLQRGSGLLSKYDSRPSMSIGWGEGGYGSIVNNDIPFSTIFVYRYFSCILFSTTNLFIPMSHTLLFTTF